MSPGPISGAASSASDPSAASFSAARTTLSTSSSRTPDRDTTPTAAPAARRSMAITVSRRERATPFVVSVFPAQRRFAVDVSSAMTTQSLLAETERACSTMSCGRWLMPLPLPC